MPRIWAWASVPPCALALNAGGLYGNVSRSSRGDPPTAPHQSRSLIKKNKKGTSKEKEKRLTRLGQCPIIIWVSQTMPSISKWVSEQRVTTAVWLAPIHGLHFEGLLSRRSPTGGGWSLGMHFIRFTIFHLLSTTSCLGAKESRFSNAWNCRK